MKWIFEYISGTRADERNFLYWGAALKHAKKVSRENEGWEIYFYSERHPERVWSNKDTKWRDWEKR